MIFLIILNLAITCTDFCFPIDVKDGDKVEHIEVCSKSCADDLMPPDGTYWTRLRATPTTAQDLK